MNKQYFVYILSSKRNGTLYVGVTNNLVRRVSEHREGKVKGFTSKYGVSQLVHYSVFSDIEEALVFEKRVKSWKRQ